MKTSALKIIIKEAVREAIQEELKEILGDTASTFTSNNVQTFQPQVGMDVSNGTLPAGEVDMSQIAGLMGK